MSLGGETRRERTYGDHSDCSMVGVMMMVSLDG